MTTRNTNGGASLRSLPNLSEVAKILEISSSTLSRREDLQTFDRGERDQVLVAGEVLRLATIYRRRALNDVAQDLLERVAEAGEDERARVEEEVEQFFEARELGSEDLQSFMETARRVLPQELFEEVESALKERGDRPPAVIIGYPPLPGDVAGRKA